MASFASAWPIEVRRERFRGCDMKQIAVRAQQGKRRPTYPSPAVAQILRESVERVSGVRTYSLKRVGEQRAGDKLIADLANGRLTCLRKNDEGVYRKAWSRDLTPAEVKANTPKGGYST